MTAKTNIVITRLYRMNLTRISALSNQNDYTLKTAIFVIKF